VLRYGGVVAPSLWGTEDDERRRELEGHHDLAQPLGCLHAQPKRNVVPFEAADRIDVQAELDLAGSGAAPDRDRQRGEAGGRDQQRRCPSQRHGHREAEKAYGAEPSHQPGRSPVQRHERSRGADPLSPKGCTRCPVPTLSG
jgi:hypothetical protein